MSTEVIRQDIVQVDFNVDSGGLTQVNTELNDLKQSMTGAIDSAISNMTKGFDGLKQSISGIGSSSGINDMKNDLNAAGAALDNAKNSAQGFGDGFGEAKTAVDKLKNSIQQGGSIISSAKEKITAFANSAKSIVTHPIETFTNKMKELVKVKVDNVKTGLQNIRNTLTDGESGAKGFVNMLKSIGKVSVSKVASGITTVKEGISKGADAAKNFASKIKEFASTNLSKLKSELSTIATKIGEIASKAGGAALSGLKKMASVSFKALSAGLAAVATGVGTLVASAVSSYADYEQLVGGVETLFKDSASTVQEYANNAFMTAGLSANDYMETVTSFSASLISSLGGDTAAAADLANQAITDMSDNANKMGTDMESIQNAYSGFAKQNYTMLDNLNTMGALAA